MSDRVEFYRVGQRLHFASVASSLRPAQGERVSIKGKTYVVLEAQFAVDYSDTPQAAMRCNVIVEPYKE